MAKVTLQSIADEVGVSRMTVSNAFSRPEKLSADLRARILAVAEELGYVGPDPAARALARGRTGTVGLLMSGRLGEQASDPVGTEFLVSVADALSDHGLALTLIHLISIPVTNTSVNPARSTGPALFVGDWALDQLWLFWVMPIIGAALAGVVYRTIFEADDASLPPITGRPT